MNTATLTFTRFLAAIMVVIFHCGKDVFPFNLSWFHYFFTHGGISVTYFFFVSGFVMVIAYYDKIKEKKFTAWNYWKNRFSRIYPLYILSLLLFVGLSVLLWGNTIILKEIVLSVLLIHAWDDSSAMILNFPSWSLSVEFFFYFTFPLFIHKIAYLSKNNLITLAILFWLATQLCSLYLFIYSEPISYSPLLHFNTFLAGTIFGLLLKRELISHGWMQKYAPVFLITSVLLIIAVLAYPNPIIEYSNSGLLVPLFAVFIGGLIFINNWITRLFNSTLLTRAGDVSYGIYILQYPCVLIARYITDKLGIGFEKESASEFYFYLFILLIIASSSYYFFEMPFKKHIRLKSVFYPDKDLP